MLMETDRPCRISGTSALEMRLLGPLAVSRDGAALALPASRKVRALLAYLALTPHAVTRSHLCDLLWDVPDDPRGELRWCLSKLRRIVDEPERRRIEAAGDTVRLDLADCAVDALELARASDAGIATLAPERLRALSQLFAGDVADGLEVDRSPGFNTWLIAQRRRFRGYRSAMLERLAASASGPETLEPLEQQLQLAPFDARAHQALLGALARGGRLAEGEQHVAAAARLFAAEGLDSGPLHDAWRTARAQGAPRSCPRPSAAPLTDDATPQAPCAPARRASIAVMPFVDRSAAAGPRGGAADALAHDLTTRLAKLRNLFVIAQGTAFALYERAIDAPDAGRALNVDYLVTGAVLRQGRRAMVTVELAEARSARVVWAEVFHPRSGPRSDDLLAILEEIGDRIVASIASEIETVERNRAILKPPSSLDAWEAYHRGLWHMYRFERADNEAARHFFASALRLDPTFARAYAGLSFAHFQNAFQGWAQGAAGRNAEVDHAFAAAGQSLMADDRDPAAHWAMGRALWLRGRHDQSVVELERAIDLSPNFALGHYTLSFVQSQAGEPDAAIAASDHSRTLSPFDPLLPCMLGTRAMALVRLRRFEEAAQWGIKAAARPNAHAHIMAIAAYALALAGRRGEARAHLATIRRTVPGYRVDDFLTAMRFAPDGAALFREGAALAAAA
jgi:DNA-binding SARP family transcriptional activator/TolB-like protein